MIEFPFGPGHPGSGNFSLRIAAEGERVVKARSCPGYLHRGFEKLMEYRTPMQNSVLSDRLCVLGPLGWNLLHAEAVEKLRGVQIPKRVQYIRVIMAELSRIQSHMIWFSVMSMALGYHTGFNIVVGYRDYILDIFEMITGGRVYPAGYICPGGVRRDFPDGVGEKISKVLDQIDGLARKLENPVFEARLRGVGVLELDDAIALGATGPVLRASGFEADVRKQEPYEAYDELDFDIPTEEDGDAYARFSVGLSEMEQSARIIKQALQKMPDEEIEPVKPKPVDRIPEGEVYVRNEIARGEGAVYMVGDGTDRPYRCKIRGPSLCHLIPILEHLLPGHEVADIPAIYWSLNGCPADMDR
ncbi:MAG: nickel-dependent hydrogenase large subunit [Armatimonadota bacterium]